MYWIHVPEEQSAQRSCDALDGEPSATSSMTPIASSSSCNGCETDGLTRHQSGMTSLHSTGDRGVDEWISSLEVSRVSRLASQDSDGETMTPGIFGPRFGGSFAKWDVRLRSWRTCQVCLPLGEEESPISEPYSESWPKTGMARNGVACRQREWGLHTNGNGSGLCPTPTYREDTRSFEEHLAMRQSIGSNAITSLAVMAKAVERDCWPTPKGSPSGPDFARAGREGSGGDDLATAAARFPTPQAADIHTLGTSPEAIARKALKGQLNPDWVEVLMGWPVGWTSLEPLPLADWDPMAPGWPETWEDGLPRVTTGTEQRRNRLKTIGNGWVPQVLVVVLARIAVAFDASVTS